MDTVRVAIVGVGNIGGVHASAIYGSRIKGMTLTALCDIDPEKRALLSERFPGVPVFEDADGLIRAVNSRDVPVDAVIVSAPHRFHSEIAVKAFRAGLNVLTEKPADVRTTDALGMNEAAVRSGKVFGIMFNQRTDPVYARAREIIRSGELGGFKRSSWIITNWYRTQAYYESSAWRATWNGEGGGVLLNQAPHNIDLWLWMLGMPESVRAVCREGKYHNIAVEDEATVFAGFPGGGSGVFVTSTGEAPGLNRLEMAFDRGRMVIEEGKLKLTRLKTSEREFCFNSKDFCALPETEETVFDACEARDGHEIILENFAAAVLCGEELIAPGRAGIDEIAFSNAAFLSSWTGRTVGLPLSAEDATEFNELLDRKRAAENEKGKAASRIAPKTGCGNGNGHSPEYSERWKTRW